METEGRCGEVVESRRDILNIRSELVHSTVTTVTSTHHVSRMAASSILDAKIAATSGIRTHEYEYIAT